jgi:hypothetical protein
MRWALALALAALLAVPASASACGMPLEASVPSEQALVTYTDGQEEIVASLALDGAGPDAAVVFPVPADAKVSVLQGEENLFAYLASVTTTPLSDSDSDEAGAGAPTGAGGGVDVTSREVIGGYDVTTLRADDPAALKTWLDENGYTTPAGAEPILADYVEQGWSYVAVKLAEEPPADGVLRPLRIAFPSAKIVYPKRLDALADEPVKTTIYVVADGRAKIDALQEEFSAKVEDLRIPPPAEFAELFARGSHLTKLSSDTLTDAQLSEDFVFALAPDGEDGGTSWWIYVLVVLAVLALVAVLLRQRNSPTPAGA